MIAPKEESVALVKNWLDKELSDAKISVVGDYVTVQGTVNGVEKLLKTKYSAFGRTISILLGNPSDPTK